eukprot:1161607-Pelagomonas_calceolata.AAC.8
MKKVHKEVSEASLEAKQNKRQQNPQYHCGIRLPLKILHMQLPRQAQALCAHFSHQISTSNSGGSKVRCRIPSRCHAQPGDAFAPERAAHRTQTHQVECPAVLLPGLYLSLLHVAFFWLAFVLLCFQGSLRDLLMHFLHCSCKNAATPSTCFIRTTSPNPAQCLYSTSFQIAAASNALPVSSWRPYPLALPAVAWQKAA